jgi:hypothetical protein
VLRQRVRGPLLQLLGTVTEGVRVTAFATKGIRCDDGVAKAVQIAERGRRCDCTSKATIAAHYAASHCSPTVSTSKQIVELLSHAASPFETQTLTQCDPNAYAFSYTHPLPVCNYSAAKQWKRHRQRNELCGVGGTHLKSLAILVEGVVESRHAVLHGHNHISLRTHESISHSTFFTRL